MPAKDAVKIKQFPLRMPEELRKRIGHVAVERGICLTHCIIDLLRERLEELEECHTSVPNEQHARQAT